MVSSYTSTFVCKFLCYSCLCKALLRYSRRVTASGGKQSFSSIWQHAPGCSHIYYCIWCIFNFCKFSETIKHRIFPPTYHMEHIQKKKWLQIFSRLYIWTIFYSLKLDNASNDPCIIATPSGKFQYCCLPMGVRSIHRHCTGNSGTYIAR